jgi:hypothetical protein
MVPLRPKDADRHFVVGAVYRLVEQQDRSPASHAHYFAAVTDAWQNLPEGLSAHYPTPDHLRKHALIRAGYFNSSQFIAANKTEAVKLAAWLRPIDEYAIVTVEGCIVTRLTAKSQDMRSMDKRTFQESKTAVLAIVAEMIGTTPTTLSANAGQAA